MISVPVLLLVTAVDDTGGVVVVDEGFGFVGGGIEVVGSKEEGSEESSGEEG